MRIGLDLPGWTSNRVLRHLARGGSPRTLRWIVLPATRRPRQDPGIPPPGELALRAGNVIPFPPRAAAQAVPA
jgi:hypothetical protein